MLPTSPTVADVRNAAVSAVATAGDAVLAPLYAAIRQPGPAPQVQQLDAMSEALALRFIGGEPSAPARDFMGLSFAEAARICLERSGRRLNRLESRNLPHVIALAHTTSDFPQLLGGAVNRVLQVGYQRAPAAIKAIAAPRPGVRDFRDITSIRFAGVSRLALVNEMGDVEHGTAAEAGETYRVRTWGRNFRLSREAMVNDDLSAFSAASLFGAAAAETEAAELVTLLALNAGAGPNLRDGAALFRTASNNLAAAGTVLDVTNVAAGIVKLRAHTDAAGNLVAAEPALLVVGPEQELPARQLIAAVTAGSLANVNPYTGAFELVVEPRITGKVWYVFAAPSRVAVVEMATLEGTGGSPVVEQFTTPDNLGITFRIVHDFGLGAVGRAGVWKNPGA